ncbi:iron complex outermembrane recepter protein [Duganella sp. CF458]|uniref:TonB-dependent siderophore receptor n=1 Tax=Duganella sp. CF458 TaxID=1884368 RepID=UPI0008EC1B1D|nr:TonB-dependent receptor [Duganella sp. CF458]SFG77448.1 iron complex outermembrane recepter protein [Duganella sp. CF458]
MKKNFQLRAVPGALALLALTAGAEDLQSVEVVGRRDSGSYLADDAQGSKTELALRELPQAVRIMPRQVLDDLGALRIDDALDYAGGVSRQNSFGGLWDNIAIRGLAGDPNNGMALLLNGFAANRGGINAPRDTAAVERIEFLKGPVAALYGASEPGGTLNIVSKRPLWRPAYALDAVIGSFGLRRAALDATGPLGHVLAWRLNAASEKRDSFRDHVQSRRTLLAPALTIKAGPDTRLEYRGELLRHTGTLDRGVAAVNGVLGAVPRERFLGEPADGDIRIFNSTQQLMLEHTLSVQWQLRAGLLWKRGTLDGYATEPAAALDANQRTLRRQRRLRDYASDDLGAHAELAGRVAPGHELLLGVEAFRFDYDLRMSRASPSAAAPYAIDVLAPVYGQPQPMPSPFTDTLEKQRNVALYAQDTMHLGERWRAVAGMRHDRHGQTLSNRRNGSIAEQQPHASSPRVGASYLATPEWTLFANWGSSFRPNTGSDARGNAFAPERGRASEAGLKWEQAGGRLGATLAVFDIRKRNALTTDPVQPSYSVAAGEVRSRGLDFDLAGQLGRSWRANASLSLLDAEVLRDNTLEQGGRLLNVPRVNGSLMLVYEGILAGQRFALGGGATHTGRRLGESRTQAQANAGAAPFELPAYTVARLVAHWHIARGLRLSLDIDNVFDKTYYTSSYQRTWVAPGSARAVSLGLQASY